MSADVSSVALRAVPSRSGEVLQVQGGLGLEGFSEELFRALTAQAPVGVFVTDRVGETVYTNARLSELTGLTPSEARGYGWTTGLHPDDAERVTAAWARAAQTEEDFSLEYRFLHQGGSVTSIEAKASAVRDPRGALVGWVGVVVDLTERKASEERYRELFENANDAVFSADIDGRLTSVNRASELITGLSRQELLGRNLFELIAPEDVERAREALDRRLKGAPNETLSLTLVTRTGGQAFVEVSAWLAPEHGQPTRIEAIARDVTEQRSLQQALTHQAFHDSLTGLANRPLFLDRLEQALARHARDGHGVAVMLLDLDAFKLVNDSLGHGAGDEVLREVARILTRAIRPMDTVARFGGDEFAFLIEGVADKQAIAAIADRILAGLAESRPVDRSAGRVSGTLGVVVADPGVDADTLLRNADTAMYRCKERRRGGYAIFDEGMRARVQREQEVQHALAAALESSELSLYYQPIVAVADGRLLGAEALLRWQHPQWGWVQPTEFIPIAEQSELIVPLSDYVIGEAARQAAAWRSRYPDALPWGIAFNLSPRELSDDRFLEKFDRKVSTHGADASDLAVEVTERTFLNLDHGELSNNLTGLSERGVRLSLDDFGTGYSAMASLIRFPFAVVKIDRSFIRGLTATSAEAPIADAITSLGHTLGMQVIAEGVETDFQAEYVRSGGCDAAQGFHYARPQPAAGISARLESRQPPEDHEPSAA